MSDRYDLENLLLAVEKAARDALPHAENTDEGDQLEAALARLDSKRSAIRARMKLEAGGRV